MATQQDSEAKSMKIKKPSLKRPNDQVFKVKLNKKEEDAVQEQTTDEVPVRDESETSTEVSEQNVEETIEQPTEESKKEVESPIVEVVDEPAKEEAKVQEPVVEQKKLPENIDKLVTFMEETGGTVEDYVRLNRDYSNVNDDALLIEYYKQTKPHLNQDEIEFLIEDKFSYDEEVEEQKEIKKKQLAAKEELAEARKFLENTKSKYYDEIKLRPGVTQEQQKAMDFFNRYNKEQQIAEERHKTFSDNTNKLFNNDFKGFEFNVGEKRFRYNVNNVNDVAKKQSNLNTFVKKFLNNEGEVVDTVGYHKAIYTADNADTIANHFYEQGKADAIKDMMAKSKNITNDPRPQSNGDIFINGLKVKAISGVDSSKLRVKTKK